MTASQLCIACRAIFHGSLQAIEAPQDANYPPEQQRHTHHDSPESLIAAIELGCAICRRVRSRLAGRIIVPRLTRKLALELTQGRRRCTTWVVVRTAVMEDGEVDGQEGKLGLSLIIVVDRSYVTKADWLSTTFAILPHHTVPLPQLPRTYGAKEATASSNTGSEAAWSLAQHWYGQCIASHKTCGPADPDFLPTRLLQIDLQDPLAAVRLVVTAEEQQKTQFDQIQDVDAGNSSNLRRRRRYASLSHCWGGANVPTLTSNTIQALRRGVSPDSLPRTFADAIAVTRKLAIAYLWIDSLCIVQDSPADWAVEAGIMGDVYSNSTVNIMATASRDSHGGLFRNRADPQTGLMTLGLIHVESAWNNSMVSGGINGPDQHRPPTPATRSLLHLAEEDLWQVSVAEAPLNARGWVLQERVLASRALHFGKEQLLWECRGLSACEVYPTGLPNTLLANIDRIKPTAPPGSKNEAAVEDTRAVPGSSESHAAPSTQLDVLKRHLQEAVLAQLRDARHEHWMFETASLWSNWVEAYSAAKLTRRSDKMIAISGLAKYMRLLRDGDRYLAGLWEHGLLDQLVWYAIHLAPNRMPSTGSLAAASTLEPTREQTGIPSWSWASIETMVIPGFPLTSSAVRHIDVVDVKTTPAPGHDDTGVLLGGELHVKPACPLLKGTMSPLVKLHLHGMGRVDDAEVHLDEEVRRQIAVVLVKVMTHNGADGTEVSTLLLRSVDTMPQGYYRRVGCLTTYSTEIDWGRSQDSQRSLFLQHKPGVFVIV
ncbi:HET domain-containing protein [Microdochium nivale]|nr:HET domain-containing protein [Microdochium nivale]